MVNISIGRFAYLIRQEERLEQIYRYVTENEYVSKKDILRIYGAISETEVCEDE